MRGQAGVLTAVLSDPREDFTMREVLGLSSGGDGDALLEAPFGSSNNNNGDKCVIDDNKSDDSNNNNGSESDGSGGEDEAVSGTQVAAGGLGQEGCATGTPAAAVAAQPPPSPPPPDAPAVVKVLSSQPGYLELSEERAKELLSDRAIEELYDVEDQPFARGKYATVRRCRCRRTGQQFAAKVVRKRRRSADLRPEILHEVAVLDACRGCPRIVRLHRVFESASDMVLLLELAAGGELQMVLDRDEVPEEREVARLMRQILHGLIFLHDINVAHLDLKPQNLVLTGDFPDCDVKLCDFGISRYLSEGADVREILGTPDYVAPEVLNYEPISLATDMWSVGVLLYVLLTGCSPFGGETKQETFCNISQCRLDFPDDLFEDVSDNAKDLMRRLIVKDPKHRLSANECLQHHWFAAVEQVASPLPARRHSVPVAPPSPCPPPLPATPPPPPPPATPAPAAATEAALSSRRPPTASALDRSQSAHALLSTPLSRCPRPRPGLASADSLDSLDSLGARAHSTPRSGISATRRDTFLRNMESIAKRVSVAGDMDVGVDTDADLKTAPARTRPTARAARATAMQTMPVRGLARAFEVTASATRTPSSSSPASRPAGLVAMGLAGLATSAVDLRSDGTLRDKEAIFKFRKVFVLEDVDAEDLDALSHLPISSMSPPPSINGSTGSGLSSGSSVYSDTSISDSNSDTVSELSVDSSSDRSSIISLDHDDQYPWDMAYARMGLGLGLGRLYHPGYNVWERASGSASGSVSGPAPTSTPRSGSLGAAASGSPLSPRPLYPRECNGSFARALSRFAAEPEDKTRTRAGAGAGTACSGSLPGPGPRPRPMPPKPILSKLALMQTAMNNGKRCGLELMREKNGNLVVIREIREVKPGGRYARFSEVKCESVQSRIRKLQVQGAKS